MTMLQLLPYGYGYVIVITISGTNFHFQMNHYKDTQNPLLQATGNNSSPHIIIAAVLLANT